MNKPLQAYWDYLANEEYDKMENPIYSRTTWGLLFRSHIEKALRHYRIREVQRALIHSQGTNKGYVQSSMRVDVSEMNKTPDSLFDLIDEQHQYFDIGIVGRIGRVKREPA